MEHYSEDGSTYEDEIRQFTQLRFLAAQNPSRDQAGLDCLLEYYIQFENAEKRFLPPDRNTGIHFEWYVICYVQNLECWQIYSSGCIGGKQT